MKKESVAQHKNASRELVEAPSDAQHPLTVAGNARNAERRVRDAAFDLLAALRFVDQGLRSGHIKDQSLIDRNSDGPEAKIVALSAIVRAAIAKAGG